MSELEKTKKPRTQKQIEATEKLVARNKQKRADKLALKNNPVPDTTAIEDSTSINEVVPDEVVPDEVPEVVHEVVPEVVPEVVITKPKRKYVKKPKPPPEPEPEPEPEKHYSNYVSDHSDSLSESYSDDEILIQKPPPVKKSLKVPRRFRVN